MVVVVVGEGVEVEQAASKLGKEFGRLTQKRIKTAGIVILHQNSAGIGS